jgi:hypothetical protein
VRHLQIVNQNIARAPSVQKNSTILATKEALFSDGGISMRLVQAIFVATIAALLAAAAPGLAKNAETPKTSEQPAAAAASCHSYQMSTDGSWTELPCQELGAPTPSHKSSPRKTDDEDR